MWSRLSVRLCAASTASRAVRYGRSVPATIKPMKWRSNFSRTRPRLLGHRDSFDDSAMVDRKPVVKLMEDTRMRIGVVGPINSGKSTLFNALADEPVPKQNITSTNLGSTRDCVEVRGNLEGMVFTVIDTPGPIEEALVDEAQAVLDSVDLAIVTIDATTRIVFEHEAIADFLRTHCIPAVLVLTKCDLVDVFLLRERFEECKKLGLGTPITLALKGNGVGSPVEGLGLAIRPVFAQHAMTQRRQDWSIEDRAASGDEHALETVRLRNTTEKFVRIAIIGRPCTGKSTLFNRLIGFDRNRVDEFSATRDAVEVSCTYRGRKIRLVDTAGMMTVKRRRHSPFRKAISASTMKALSFAHVCIIVMDSRRGQPTAQDMAIAHKCADEGRAFVFACNKWDSVDDPVATAEAFDFKIKKQINEVHKCPAVVCSGLSGLNLTLLLDQALTAYDTWNKSIPASTLNKFWKKYEKSVVIPHHVARIWRLKQVAIRPPTFTLHLNTKDDMILYNSPLQTMVRNAIVEEFGFRGVPVRLIQEVKDPHKDVG